jgi:hypothetical protein
MNIAHGKYRSSRHSLSRPGRVSFEVGKIRRQTTRNIVVYLMRKHFSWLCDQTYRADINKFDKSSAETSLFEHVVEVSNVFS